MQKTYAIDPVMWGNFAIGDFCDQLVEWIGDRKVLETFAGNGVFASMLAERKVAIRSTSLFASHDGHRDGMYFDVIEMDATKAVHMFGDESDILLMCWPTSTEAAFKTAARWGAERPIVFIGEVTQLDKGLLGGCASDNFFEVTDEISVFSAYTPRSYIDRAAVRQLNPEKFGAWRDEARKRILSGADQMNALMSVVLD
jgi:hypothetical protein|nr:hypothetical protein [Neorhizobium tomejilense]